MCELMLVRPSKQYAEQVMLYKEEMLRSGDSFDGCAGLEDVHRKCLYSYFFIAIGYLL